jgi:Uma2 family endonuclease
MNQIFLFFVNNWHFVKLQIFSIFEKNKLCMTTSTPNNVFSKEHYTVEEYLVMDSNSPIRYEYHFGKVKAMAGTTKKHNETVQNITFLLRKQLKNKGCGVYAENIRTQIYENSKYVYPDVVVSCSEQDKKNPLLVKEPTLVVEVLSEGTEEYDIGNKLLYYTRLASMTHYILVSQESVAVMHYQRMENENWQLAIYTHLTDVILLNDLELTLSLSEIYENIDIEEVA